MEQGLFDSNALVEAFTRYDAGQNEGRGRSEDPDSGALGWGESGVLDGYVKMYEATGDVVWLDRVVDHFDRMTSGMKDHFGDGFPTWVTATYSVAMVRAGRMHNRGTAEVSPLEERVWVIRGGADVRDREYAVEILPGRKYRVAEYGTRKRVGEGTFRPGKPIEALAPFKVVISGKPQPGDRFWVQTFAGEPLEYIVHQGMFLYPVSRFIEAVLKDRKLKARYGKKAQGYLDLIEKQVARKHERDWVDMTPSAGGYRFSPWKTERFPNRLMPHNQYLALARAFLVLASVSRKRIFADRAERMAKNFKRCLRRTGRAYTWYYWDWMEAGEPGHSGVEDTGHGHIDIGFAVEACRRGVVFRDADLKRFAHTLLDRMWNGSLDDPRIGGRVDTKEGDAKVGGDWVDLCQWNPKVWDVVWAQFCKEGQPANKIPSMLQGWARLAEGKEQKGRTGKK